jgi:hypothetical protein
VSVTVPAAGKEVTGEPPDPIHPTKSPFLRISLPCAAESVRALLLRTSSPGPQKVREWLRAYVLLFHAVLWTQLTLIAWRVLGLDFRKVPIYASRFDLLARAAVDARRAGLWLEFGVASGRTINFVAQRTDRTILGFDTFQGLPSRWALWHPKGYFDAGGKMPVVRENVVLIVGEFRDTLPGVVAQNQPLEVAFLHVDSDLYSSAGTILQELETGFHAGTIVVFDEFVTLYPDDESRAFREFLVAAPRAFRYLGGSLDGSVAIEFTSERC